MMVDVSTIALSGFSASEARLTAAANNIANANTPNFRAQTVAQTANADGGVSTQFVAANVPAPQPVTTTQDAAQTQPQGNDVDVDKEVVNANFSTYSAQANLKVLQTQNKLDKYLLDIQA